MPGAQMSVSGLDNLSDTLRANLPEAKQAVKVELYQFCEEVMTASKEIVPVLLTALMNSGKVRSPAEDGEVISVTMGYGDEASPYALYVHEALEGPHAIDPNWSWAKKVAKGGQIDWTRPGSGPKYLTRPLQERQDKLPGRLRDVFIPALKGE